jgi:hypothetical protein
MFAQAADRGKSFRGDGPASSSNFNFDHLPGSGDRMHLVGGNADRGRTGEDNADAHMKRQIMGREVVVAITAGKLDFGPWEQIFYGEFEGRRRKRVLVKIIGE